MSGGGCYGFRCGFQRTLFSLKKRRAVSDDSKLASSNANDDGSNSRSERSDVAVRCARVNKGSARHRVTESATFVFFPNFSSA